MIQDRQDCFQEADWRRRPYDGLLSLGDLRRTIGLEASRLADWRERKIISENLLVGTRAYTFVEALALALIIKHDDENHETRRLRDFADALFTAISTASTKAIAAHLLPLACVHAVLRDADAAGCYREAAVLATCDPAFGDFESYSAYKQSLPLRGIELSTELQAAIDIIGPLDVWHLQLFCDLISEDTNPDGGLMLLTYDFDNETFVTSFIDGSPMPLAIDDDRIDRATMIALRPVVELIEKRLRKLSGIRS